MNEEDIKKAFASVLRAERARRNMSQLALSLDADINKKFISYLETGKSLPSLFTLIKIAKAFQINFSELANEIQKELDKKI